MLSIIPSTVPGSSPRSQSSSSCPASDSSQSPQNSPCEERALSQPRLHLFQHLSQFTSLSSMPTPPELTTTEEGYRVTVQSPGNSKAGANVERTADGRLEIHAEGQDSDEAPLMRQICQVVDLPFDADVGVISVTHKQDLVILNIPRKEMRTRSADCIADVDRIDEEASAKRRRISDELNTVKQQRAKEGDSGRDAVVGIKSEGNRECDDDRKQIAQAGIAKQSASS